MNSLQRGHSHQFNELDWPEDSSHENGNYSNRCLTCLEYFVGHKRRMTCKKCHNTEAARWAALSEREKAGEIEEAKKVFDSWFFQKIP
jgi:hypothetical protein